MNTEHFLKAFHAKQDFRRDCVKPGTYASEEEKKQVKELCESSSKITNLLDALNSFNIMDEKGVGLSYGLYQAKYGNNSSSIILEIFFGNNPKIGIQFNNSGKGIEYVFGGQSHLINDEAQLEEFFEKIIKNIADNTFPDLLNDNLRNE